MAKLTQADIEGVEVSGQVPPLMDKAFVQRIIESDNKPSKKSGCEMVKLVTEIVKPEKILMKDGVTYNMVGQKVTYYFPLRSLKGEAVTKRLRKQYSDFRAMMGVDPFFDLEDPEHEDLQGLGFRSLVRSEERIPTEVDDEGNRVQIKDEETGQPVSKGWRMSLGNPSEIYNKVDLGE